MRSAEKLANLVIKYYCKVLCDLGHKTKYKDNINGFIYFSVDVDSRSYDLRLISQYQLFGQYYKPNGTLYSVFDGIQGIAEAVVDLDINDHNLVVKSFRDIIADTRRGIGSNTRWVDRHYGKPITQI